MVWQPVYPISTARLRLRPLVAADVDALLTYRADPDVCRYLPFEPMTRAVLSQRLAGDLGRTAIMAEGDGVTLGVEEAGTGRLVGDVVLFYRSVRDATSEIGYVFHPDVAGRGYATEACTAVLDSAFGEDFAMHRVFARMDGRNDASARLAERLGMRREAAFQQSEMFKGEWADVLIYAVLHDEWRASRQQHSG